MYIGYGPIEQLDILKNGEEVKKMIKSKELRKSGNTYFSNTSKLGEILMEIMLQEVSEFCKIDMKQSWATQAHQQVFYVDIYKLIKYESLYYFAANLWI